MRVPRASLSTPLCSVINTNPVNEQTMAEPSNEPVMPSFANLTPMLQFPDVTSTTEPVMPTPVDLNLVNNSDFTSILVSFNDLSETDNPVNTVIPPALSDDSVSPNVEVNVQNDLLNFYIVEENGTPQSESTMPSTSTSLDIEMAESIAPDNNNIIPLSNENDENPQLVKLDTKPRKARYKNVKRDKNKNLRRQGKPYQSYHKQKESGKYKLVDRPAKVFKQFCSKHPSTKDKNKQCSKVSENTCLSIRKQFLECENIDARRTLLKSLIKVRGSKKPRVEPKDNAKSRRARSMEYYLKVEGEMLQVCREMFMATYGLTENEIRGIVSHMDVILPQPKEIITGKKSGRRRAENCKADDNSFIESFFQNIPKVSSHYCRKRSSKIYLEQFYQTKQKLYDVYSEECEKAQRVPLSLTSFKRYFENSNYSLFKPKKDKCEKCCMQDNGNWNEEKFGPYETHYNRKEIALAQKEMDKKNVNDTTMLISEDTQSVLISPKNESSSMYYRNKLNIHNLSYYNHVTRQGDNYLWPETEGGLDCNHFVSIQINHLDKELTKNPHYTDVIQWSDNCEYQNKSKELSSAFLNLAKKHNVTIIQKYLEPGHTHMEVDQMHQKIEVSMKGKNIQHPNDYIDIITKARKYPEKYNVEMLDYKFFKNYKKACSISSIRPGRMTGDPHVNDLRLIKYTPTGEIYLKTDHQHAEWLKCPGRIWPAKEPERLYMQRLKISKKKFDDLQVLKETIPQNNPIFPNINHLYYDDLPHMDK